MAAERRHRGQNLKNVKPNLHSSVGQEHVVIKSVAVCSSDAADPIRMVSVLSSPEQRLIFCQTTSLHDKGIIKKSKNETISWDL